MSKGQIKDQDTNIRRCTDIVKPKNQVPERINYLTNR